MSFKVKVEAGLYVPNGPTDWVDVKRRIIDTLGPEGVAREYAALGIRFEGGLNGKSKIQCHAVDRNDEDPSAFVDCRNGIYHTQGGNGETLNLFDFALKYGTFGDWLSTVKHYADITRVTFHARRDSKGRILESVYSYTDEVGALLYEVLRYRLPNGKKKLSLRRPNGKGDWEWNIDGVRRVLYQLPRLFANPDHYVFVVEGEKDTDRLNALFKASGSPGVATSSALGADDTKKWDTYKESLRGRSCLVIPDADPPGMAHATGICGYLHGVASEVRLLELPDVGLKGDVSDWLDQGHTLDELWELAKLAPEFNPASIAVDTQLEREAKEASRPSSRQVWPCTDLGNAERMAHQWGLSIRYCKPWKKWLVWTGQRWSLDDLGRLNAMSKSTMRKIYDEAAKATDQRERERLGGWAIRCESVTKINAMLSLVCWEPDIPVLPTAFDADPWLLNCPNGTIDLRKCEIRKHGRADMITRMVPVEFDSGAKCPLWDRTIDTIFAGKSDLIGFVQQIFGMCLTGDASEQILPIFHGSGANGKSTILNALLEILGSDYGIMAPPGLLFQRAYEGHPTERACLFGKRAVVDMESAEGGRLNEALVKQLTGSDRIEARRMREDFWSFEPTHKIIMCTNHRPEIRETKNAIWRRVKLVPFTVEIPEDKQIKDLAQQLKPEYPGILAWCVRGCLDWHNNGLRSPVEVEDATAAYRKEQDALAWFIDEECSVIDTLTCKASVLYERYRKCAELNGRVASSRDAWGAAMTEKGFVRYTNNGTWYRGIALRSFSVAVPNA
jgi:putative DNA primase/helicase